jgi:hypothetical protein
MSFNLTRPAFEITFKVLILLGLGYGFQSRATELSGQLSANDVRESASILALGSVHRAWTAPAVEGEGLGLSVGLESSFVFRKDLLSLGDDTAIAPRVIPVPRLWLAWDLPEGISLSASLAPGRIFDGIDAYGGAVQYVFFEDAASTVASSLLVDYTWSKAFGDLSAGTMGASLQITKDLTLWQPYVGVGMLVTNARAREALMNAGVKNGPYTVAVVHGYVGLRLDLIAKLAFQVDLMGALPSAAILLSNEF